MNSARCLHLVLLLALAYVVPASTQNCPYDHQNCTCIPDSLYIVCYDLTEIPELRTGENISRRTLVLFMGGEIRTISKNSLPPNLKSLAIYSNPLTNISVDAFERSAGTLRSIVITNASIHALPQALAQLTSLKRLTVSETHIRTWDEAILYNVSSTVEFITLTDVGLSAWPSWLSYFTLLYSLDLSSNCLTTLPDDAFTSFTQTLGVLRLENTCLTYLPRTISTLVNLGSIALSNNTFTNMTETTITLSRLEELAGLHVSYVGMTRLPNLSNLRGVNYLNLTGNLISYVSDGLFPPSLAILSIARANLISVPSVATLSELTWLEIPNNQIARIEPNSFPSNIISINLANNPLTDITDSAFGNLRLSSLYLTSTNLTEIPRGLTSLNGLRNLALSSIQKWDCPCPVNTTLVRWFTTIQNSKRVTGNCSNGNSLRSYLSGQCGLNVTNVIS